MAHPSDRAGPRHADGPVFTFTGVGVRRAQRWTLRAVTAEVPGTGVTAVVGPSGAGKTTLLRLCNRLDVPDAGVVSFRGHDVAALDPLRLRRQVGMVFQRPTVFGGTVRDNLLVARPGAAEEDLVGALRGVAVGPELLDQPAGQLSGGEAQRVCLARTLITEPEVLLLDEPTSALDAGARMAFERLVAELVRRGLPALWVTHDLDQLHRVADHVLVVAAGQLLHAGPAAALSDQPDVLALLRSGTGDHEVRTDGATAREQGRKQP
ncbi:MAG: phosphate ABC transporter ATP-binding protein [Actinobacteria bacterium]|nr:phosphate ABC transporter ATP-binding protein [Actinomycetota bacterium]MBI3688788.1 phosphate ABC transporter ATP-binding protein [Actinomycetota bacterium]